MPSVRYYNQTAPFWDFVSNLESSVGDHPFFNAYNPQAQQAREETPGQTAREHAREAADTPDTSDEEKRSSEAPQPPNQGFPPQGSSPQGPPPMGFNPFGGPPPNFEGHGPGFPFGGHRGRHGGWGGRGGRCGAGRRGSGWGFPNPGDFDMNSMNNIAQYFAQQFGGAEKKAESGASKDFVPPADIFDTEDAYVVHISLAGAKKEDVGVNWDADKSELSVAGVIYRPGDEDFLKTLAMDERKVGVFERKVRLGSRAQPAQVVADSISAKMEEGVLIVTIPKIDKEYVEIKKVDIE